MNSDKTNNKEKSNKRLQNVHGTPGYVVKEGHGKDFLRFMSEKQSESKKAMEKARRFAEKNKVDPK